MRIVVKALMILLLAFGLGFFVFAVTLPRADDFDLDKAADSLLGFDKSEIGIVALTGGGGRRIERAISLFEGSVADRVLISGTHPDVRKQDLVTPGTADIFDCCVDLGPKAQTTIGNGLETRRWARENGYKAVYLVTSEWHLPRARLELSNAADELIIVSVPVPSNTVPAEGWITDPAALNTLGREYIKFILAWTRALA